MDAALLAGYRFRDPTLEWVGGQKPARGVRHKQLIYKMFCFF